MSAFKAKMHQIQFPPMTFCISDLTGGAYNALPDSLAVFQWHTSKGSEEKGGVEGKKSAEGKQ